MSKFYSHKDLILNWKGKNQIVEVLYPGCGWGHLESIEKNGTGYVSFNSGGGQIIRDWETLFDRVEAIQYKKCQDSPKSKSTFETRCRELILELKELLEDSD